MLPLYDDQPAKRFPFVTIFLIAANVAVFAGWQLRVGLEESVQLAALVPAQITHAPAGPAALHLFSSMFMHGGVMHLLGNMWFLWVFGNKVEAATGPVRFLIFYLLCGIAAAAAHVACAPHSHLPLVGASGAIGGVLGAYLLLHPGARIATLVPIFIFIRIIELPAWVFLLVWFALQVLSQAASDAGPHRHGGGVAYLAHIGGFTAGLLLIFLFKKQRVQRKRDW
jgi:membrane associated rhomboid family serine protease